MTGIAFRSEATTFYSGHDGPAVEAVRQGSGLRITAFMGEQRTGGYAITVERIELVADELHVHATFTSPPPGAMTIQVITSPAHTVSVDVTARAVVLFDQHGVERARTTPR